MDETNEMRDFEALLTAGMHDLVDGETPPPELRERIFDRLDAPPPSRRRWLPAAAAALLVVAAVGAFVGLGDGDGGSIDVATDPDPGTEVAGVSEERDDEPESRSKSENASPTTAEPTAVPDTTIPSEPAPDDARPLPGPPPAHGDPPATTSPPTTALTCQNSTNPDCGPFRWSPEPTNRPATLELAAPDRIVAGESFRITLTMSDPDGPVTFDCFVVNGPDIATGACTVTNEPCPERYGPWSPPAPKPDQGSTHTSAVFEEPGSYIITVDVSPAQGCDNVDPYRSGASAELPVEVVAADE